MIQQAFVDDPIIITQSKEWYNRFSDGRTSEESRPRSGRLSKSRNDEIIDQVMTLVMQNRCITLEDFTDEVGISISSVHSVFDGGLAMRRMSAKFVPKLLVMTQNQLRLEVAQGLRKRQHRLQC